MKAFCFTIFFNTDGWTLSRTTNGKPASLISTDSTHVRYEGSSPSWIHRNCSSSSAWL